LFYLFNEKVIRAAKCIVILVIQNTLDFDSLMIKRKVAAVFKKKNLCSIDYLVKIMSHKDDPRNAYDKWYYIIKHWKEFRTEFIQNISNILYNQSRRKFNDYPFQNQIYESMARDSGYSGKTCTSFTSNGQTMDCYGLNEVLLRLYMF
jgi:hypothetical protein